ncbi:nuclear transport factor 2 family protein [Actinokineospora enzanensis]|uniref:nuclear transport factor 2 family protein n=1 Tax=Actinokineospora enzanensis TaxID=155975 RepID=UPI0003747B60|nr:nuclear transport factor 2 family protein [Actinokineospora enzanensis]
MPSTPTEVVRALAAGVRHLVVDRPTGARLDARLDELADLYAEDTDVRHPFSPLGDTPLRTRAELRAHFAQIHSRVPAVDGFEPVGQVHQTADPEVVIHEFAYTGTLDGRPFSIPCVFITRVRDGRIIESRDYGDHIGMARLAGRLGHLATALAAAAD